MVSGKVKAVMGFPRSSSPATPKADTPRRSSASPANSSATKNSGTSSFARSFGVYFPKSSSQVQPKPPDVADLIRVIEELQERESRLRTQLLEQKILRETVAIVPFLEAELNKSMESVKRLEMENLALREEIEVLRLREKRFREMEREIEDLKKVIEDKKREHDECSSSSSSPSSLDVENRVKLQKREINIPKPPPLPNYSFPKSYRPSSSSSSSSSSGSSTSSTSETSRSTKPSPKLNTLPPIPPPLPEPSRSSSSTAPPSLEPSRSSNSAPPPPPPLPPSRGKNTVGASKRACVKREPEVVEFYHSLMRRDSKRESNGGASGDLAPAVCPRDMIGEIENRSAHLLAIKSDVETQGDSIRCMIKEIENASFTKIDEVVTFVKWLDEQLSNLVDERAVLKHFDWPEQKADALREAAFGYCDLKKLETEASSFKDDSRHPCTFALKKMQSLLEKLEQGAYNVSRIREGAMSRYKGFRIPWDWMQESGIVSQIKLASVKLAKLYMKRVSSELEALLGAPDEEELMLQAVRFAFRVHQFAGGFDVETMRAFQELKETVSLFHNQNQNQNQNQQQNQNQNQQRHGCKSS